MALWKTVRIAVAVLVGSTGIATAADLTPSDYSYLAATYGLKAQGSVLANLTPAERANLHDLLSSLASVPAQRDEAVRNRLYDDYTRECQAWEAAHGQFCPPVQDPAAEPGKEIADRICNQCHLFGTGMAPSFFRLAQRRRWDAAGVDAALHESHDMVPLTLGENERGLLATYINSAR